VCGCWGVCWGGVVCLLFCCVSLFETGVGAGWVVDGGLGCVVLGVGGLVVCVLVFGGVGGVWGGGFCFELCGCLVGGGGVGVWVVFLFVPINRTPPCS